MRGRVDCFQRHFGNKLHVDGQILNRFGRVLGGAQRERVADEAGIVFQNLIVSELDALGAVGLEWENSHLEQILLREFQQRGILHRAHDVGVNLARLFGIEQFGFLQFAIDLHLEFFDGRALRHRKQKRAFLPSRIGIVKNLLHGGVGDLVFDFHSHLLRPQLQRREHRMRNRPGPRPRRNDNRRMRVRWVRQNAHIVANNQPARVGLKGRGQGHKCQHESK